MAKRGFTLIEMMVAVMVFSLMVGTILEIFMWGIREQRRALATQKLLDETSYTLEYMSRAVRMARKDMSGECLTTAGAKYNYETDEINRNRIRFLNYQDKCQEFFLEGNQLKEKKSTDNTASNFQPPLLLTSSDLQVKLKIGPSDSWDQEDTDQPRVTISLEAEGKEKAKINIQTTLSQRNLDIQY